MIATPPRHIRSFVRRQAHFSEKQRLALTRLWGQYGLEKDAATLDFTAIFGRDAPTVLEIGFGMGHSVLAMAQANPHLNYLGIEVHRPGVATLLGNLNKHHLTNVRVICDDALEVLHTIAPDSLAAIQIYFPDPWPKKRHHKRRLIQTAFTALVVSKLKINGMLHCATDWQDYATHILQVLSQHPNLVNPAGEMQYAPRPAWRPETKFELRGKRLGHAIWDVILNRSY